MLARTTLLAIVAVAALSSFGQSWVALPVATPHTYQDVWFQEQQPDAGVACGSYGAAFDILPFGKRTVDGGTTMAPLDLFFGGTFTGAFGLAFTDANTGYMCGGGMLKTYDGGLNWMQQMDVFTVGGTLSDVHFPAVNDGFAVGESWMSDGIAMVTHNAGATWDTYPVSTSANNDNTSLTSVAWADVDHLYAGATAAVEGSATLFLSTDDGLTWAPLSMTNGVNDLCATAGDTVFAATDAGIYRITASGSSILPVLATSAYVLSISLRQQIGFAVCEDGGIFRSVDRGASWQAMPTPVPGTVLNAVRFANDQVVYACGAGGTLLRYEDAMMGIEPSFRPVALGAYPTPCDHALNVEYPGSAPGVVHVMDVQGKVLHAQRLMPGLNVVDVAGLAPGMYILRAMDTPMRSLSFIVAR
jgi:photosystem II stability/assembly factor-like uncharacterized protein